jgi:hypothetical protein
MKMLRSIFGASFLIAVLVSVMFIGLTACGGKAPDETVYQSEEPEPISPSPAIDEPVVSFDEYNFNESYGFSEGYAWAIDEDGNSYLINTSGEAVYSTTVTSEYSYNEYVLYDVDNGIAAIGIFPDYDSISWFDSCYFIAVNTDGDEVYNGEDKPFGEDVTEVLCADGKLILLKHTANFEENKLLMGVSDLQGNITVDFKEVSGLDLMNFTYRGEGVFIGETSTKAGTSFGGSFIYYDSHTNDMTVIDDGYQVYSDWGYPNGEFYNGLIQVSYFDNYTHYICMLSREKLLDYYKGSISSSARRFTWEPPSSVNSIGENMGEYENYIYDLTAGSKLFSLLPNREKISDFHNGVISESVEGADGGTYVVMFDNAGKQLFEPKKIDGVTYLLGDFIFTDLADDDYEMSLINKEGNVMPITDDDGNAISVSPGIKSDSKWISYFSEGLCPIVYEDRGAYLGDDGKIKITSIKVRQS